MTLPLAIPTRTSGSTSSSAMASTRSSAIAAAGAAPIAATTQDPTRRFFDLSATYVTGSHNIKVGMQYGYGYFWRNRDIFNDG